MAIGRPHHIRFRDDAPRHFPELEGYIAMDALFASGDYSPTAHPGCYCNLDFRIVSGRS